MQVVSMLRSPVWHGAWVVALAAMEPWAALLHHRVWHTCLWPVHRTHHRGRGDIDAARGSPGRFEHNDAMALLHAPVAMALIIYGCEAPSCTLAAAAHGVGVGMTLFGLAYLVFHDGLAHGRFLPAGLQRFAARFALCRAICRSHRVHHRTGLAPYGLFLGPWVLRRQQRQLRGRTPFARPRQQGTKRAAPI